MSCFKGGITLLHAADFAETLRGLRSVGVARAHPQLLALNALELLLDKQQELERVHVNGEE